MAGRPVTQLDKTEVLSGLFGVWDDIDALLQDAPDAQWKAMTPLPGWNVQAVISHIIGTESFLQGVPAPQPDADVKAFDHVRNDIGAMNECWVRHFSTESGAGVLEQYRATTDGRRKVLQSMSVADWDVETLTPVGPESYGRFMRVGRSTAGCTSRTSVSRWSGRHRTMTSPGPRRSYPSTRSRAPWALSSANWPRRRTVHASISS